MANKDCHDRQEGYLLKLTSDMATTLPHCSKALVDVAISPFLTEQMSDSFIAPA